MQYRQQKALYEMSKEYLDIIQELDESGGEVTSDEMLIRFLELEDNLDTILFNAYNIKEELESVIERRKERADRELEKIKVERKKIEFFKSVIASLIGTLGKKTPSGTINHKVDGISFTLSKSKASDIDVDNFDDERYITYKVSGSIPKEKIRMIQKLYHLNTEKSINTAQVLKDLKGGVEIEHASLKESDKIIIK